MGIRAQNVKDTSPLKYERYSITIHDSVTAGVHLFGEANANLSFGKLWPESGNKEAVFICSDAVLQTQTVSNDSGSSTITCDITVGGTSIFATAPVINGKTATAPTSSKDAGTGETAAVLSATLSEREVQAGEEVLASITIADQNNDATTGYGMIRLDLFGFWKNAR